MFRLIRSSHLDRKCNEGKEHNESRMVKGEEEKTKGTTQATEAR